MLGDTGLKIGEVVSAWYYWLNYWHTFVIKDTSSFTPKSKSK